MIELRRPTFGMRGWRNKGTTQAPLKYMCGKLLPIAFEPVKALLPTSVDPQYPTPSVIHDLTSRVLRSI
jgi:hypothetical protein